MPDAHVIIKGLLHSVGTEFFKEIPDCVVVEHAVGLVQKERPHYHCWIPDVPSTLDTKNRLREFYDSKISGLKWNTHANAYYTVKEHNDFDAWLNYTWTEADCKLPDLKVWNRTEERPVRLMDELILPAQDVADVITHVVPPVASRVVAKAKKSKAVAVLFYEYMVDKYIGKRDKVSKNCVKREYFKWSLYGFNDPQAVKNIRTVWYQLNQDYPDELEEECEGWISRTRIFSSDIV